MVAMRIIFLAPYWHVIAAVAVHEVKLYAAGSRTSDVCEPANLKNVYHGLGGCHPTFNGTWIESTCNGTHFQVVSYDGAQCTGAPRVLFEVKMWPDDFAWDDSLFCPCSNKVCEMGRRAEIRCNMALQPWNRIDVFKEYTDHTCRTPKFNYLIPDVNNHGCTPSADIDYGYYDDTYWQNKSWRYLHTPGKGFSITEHDSIDCSGPNKGFITVPCGVCTPLGQLHVMWLCDESVSPGRRSTPWVVTTFGAAVLAIVAALRA